MIFSIDTVCKELRWEYGYTKKKAMQMAQNGKNPMQMLQQIMGSNPQFNQVMRVINSKDPASMKSTAEKMFKERGVDMEQFAKSMGITLPK